MGRLEDRWMLKEAKGELLGKSQRIYGGAGNDSLEQSNIICQNWIIHPRVLRILALSKHHPHPESFEGLVTVGLI